MDPPRHVEISTENRNFRDFSAEAPILIEYSTGPVEISEVESGSIRKFSIRRWILHLESLCYLKNSLRNSKNKKGVFLLKKKKQSAK